MEFARPMSPQFAVGLLHASGGRIRQVRIDRLMPVPVGGMAYCATVEVESTAGVESVDARPSDAVNLAAVTGVPIRVKAGLFAAATPDPETEARRVSFPSATVDIAAETQQRLAEQAAKRRGTPPAESGTAEE